MPLSRIPSPYAALASAELALFDWDGTLVNSADFVPDIHSCILSEMAIPLEVSIIRDHLGISQTALLKMAADINGRMVTDDLIPQFVMREDQILDDYYADKRIHLRNGATELLRTLQAHKIPMAIVSNAYDDVTHKRLRDTGLMGTYFNEETVFGRTRVGTTKPNPGQILAACAAFGCAPNKAIFFGDTQSDRGACNAAGTPMIQIANKSILEPPSLITISDFSSLISEAPEPSSPPAPKL